MLKRLKQFSARHHAQRVEELYEKYEHRFGPVAMLIGVTVDFLAFQRIDLLFENLVLIGYLVIGALGITLVNLYEGGVIQGKVLDRLRLWLPLVIQFSFGGLFSAFMVFYLRSASVATSWPYFLILLGLIIGNEFFRKRYLKLTFHMSVYFLAVYSYAIFVLPMVFRHIGPWVFVASGVVSILVIASFAYLLSRAIPKRFAEAKQPLMWSIRSIVIIVNLLYFANIIPPIPLALKEAGVFHDVSRAGAEYRVVAEETKWYERFSRDTIHIVEGEPVYVFSAIFAPTHLDIPVTHHWQYQDPETGYWITADKLSYAIVGGRDGGYRGYSLKRAVFPGKWRVDVETDRGQIIGRIRFSIERPEEVPALVTKYY